MKHKLIKKVEKTDEKLETETTEDKQIWPENFETYLGDGEYSGEVE